MISLDIYGEPVAQARPRFFARGKRVCVFDSQSKLKEGCKWQLRSQYKEELLSVPVAIDFTFYMPIPKSTSKVKTKEMLVGKLLHIKKPDIDNLQKFVLDCLNKTVFEDDSQVVEIRARKLYSTKPSTLIRIYPLTDQLKMEGIP